MKRLMLMCLMAGLAAVTADLSTAAVLIGPGVQNGSFEAESVKLVQWDADPNGDVSFWSEWDATVGGPSTAGNDSGTDASGSATNGGRLAFYQPGNAAYNLTNHVVADGDAFSYLWDFATRADSTRNPAAWLVYEDVSGDIVKITGTDTVKTSDANPSELNIGTNWTATTGHAAIGRKIGLGIENPADSSYPELDNFRLDLVPEPASMALMGLGSLLMLRRRRVA